MLLHHSNFLLGLPLLTDPYCSRSFVLYSNYSDVLVRLLFMMQQFLETLILKNGFDELNFSSHHPWEEARELWTSWLRPEPRASCILYSASAYWKDITVLCYPLILRYIWKVSTVLMKIILHEKNVIQHQRKTFARASAQLGKNWFAKEAIEKTCQNAGIHFQWYILIFFFLEENYKILSFFIHFLIDKHRFKNAVPCSFISKWKFAW